MRRNPTATQTGGHVAAVAIVAGILLHALAADAKGGRGRNPGPPAYDGQYSMELQALMGPEDTQVTATLSTTEPGAFPIPEQLKKVQIKIRDESGDVVYIVNEKGAAVDGDRVVRLVDDSALHETLFIKALIDTDARVVVLQGGVDVLLRPDLVVAAVTAPEEVAVGEAFNIDVDIRELNGEVGVTANVGLYADGALVGSAESVGVDAGEVTTVVFAGLTFDDAGTKQLSVVISGAEPAEFDVSNNEGAATVEVASDLVFVDTRYTLTYWNENDYVDILREEGCRFREFWRDFRRDRSLLRLSTHSDAPLLGPVDIEWSVASEHGIERSGSTSGLSPAVDFPSLREYWLFEPAKGTFIWVRSFGEYFTQITLAQYSGTVVHVAHLNGDLETTVVENNGPHIDAQSSIAASVVVSDGQTVIGGSATAPVSLTASVDDAWSFTAYSTFWCGGYYTVHREFRYDRYEAGDRGWLTPPAAARAVAVADLPGEVRLDGSYPNPSNPATTIAFSLPQPADARLVIYDALGRRVATLVDGRHPAGRHRVEFDGSRLSSGAYFYRLTTGNFDETRKLLLLK